MSIKRLIQKLKNIYHLFRSLAASVYYGFPSRKIKVIGVTGTDGKTTTTHLIYHIIKNAGKRVSMISTVNAKVGKMEYDTGLHTTTPDGFLVQKLLKKAIEEGEEYFVLEATSQGIDQNRDFGVNYELSVLTNITHDHLDYHETYKDYALAKIKLLLRSKTALINQDDASFELVSSILKKYNKSFSTYGLKQHSDYNYDYKKDKESTITDYNNYNYLAAYSASRLIGITEPEIISAFKSFDLPQGRLDVVYDGKFKVIVDFAHTPNALFQLLKSLNENKVSGSRIIHVFGAAGLRDVAKRPLMGKESGKYADIIILTEEDYRTEDPVKICEQIASGFPTSKEYFTVINREEAIEKALSIVKKDDTILISGKGHEKSLCRGKVENPWDEREVVLRILKQNDYI